MSNVVVISIFSMAGIGAFFGIILAIASKKFAVEVDPKVEQVADALSGANCGACGYPGCSSFAEAVVEGKVSVGSCPVSGEDAIKKICSIIGSDDNLAKAKKVARLNCKGGQKEANDKAEYNGIEDCRASQAINGGNKGCQYGCLGHGTCSKICPFDAIIMNSNNLPEIIDENCTGCGKCVEICPRNVLELCSDKNEVFVGCISTEKGKDVKKNCSVGCIGCKRCEKACQFDAIHVENNIAKIDYEKCTNCMECVSKCPTKTIYSI